MRTAPPFGVLAAALLAACTATGPSTTSTDAANTPTTAAVASRRTELVDRARLDAALQGFIDRGELVGASALVFEHGREAPIDRSRHG